MIWTVAIVLCIAKSIPIPLFEIIELSEISMKTDLMLINFMSAADIGAPLKVELLMVRWLSIKLTPYIEPDIKIWLPILPEHSDSWNSESEIVQMYCEDI